MLKRFPLPLFLAAQIGAYAAQCPLSEAITGKGAGRSLSEANVNADISIAENINSSLRISSTDFFLQVEVSGVPKDSSNFLQIAAGKSFLENREAVQELKAPYEDEDGNIVAERYICKSDAAKPYLRSLGYITGELKTLAQKASPSSCRNINEIYYDRVKGLEGILEHLGQLDKAMQKEYDGYYREIIKECDKTSEDSKKTVAVYMAGEEPEGASGMHKIMGGELARVISQSEKYIAVDRTEAILQQLLAEHRYQRGGAVSDDQIKMLGEQFGVQFLCISDISLPKGNVYYLDTRLIDVVTAKIQRSATATSYLNNADEMVLVAQNIAQNLIESEKMKEQLEKERKARRFKRYAIRSVAVSFDVLGAGLVGYGLYRNNDINRYVKSDRVEDAKSAVTIRNLAYIAGSVLLLTGISIHIY